MKKIANLLLVLLLTSPVFSQWSQISTINTTQLNAVKFFNEWTGITAGVGGIWRSTNSGVNWTQVLAGANMNSISFFNNNSGLAAGNNGKISKTTDGGINWTVYQYADTIDIFAIQWFNSMIAMATGENGFLIKSTNYASSWYSLNSGTTQDLKGIYMSDGLNGFICGGTTHELCATTINGGNNWIYVLNQSGNFINSIAYPYNFQMLFLVGSNGRIRKTTNRGTIWTTIYSGVTDELNHILFQDFNNGYIAGNNGKILYTSNNGTNWVVQQTNTLLNLKCINFINNNTGWTVGQNGIVLRTGIPVGLKQIENTAPLEFKLYQNYPNPFNSETNIKIDMSMEGYVKLTIFNLIGKEIQNFKYNKLSPGTYILHYKTLNLSSGVYLYRLETNYFNDVKTFILIK